jgi:hypothetical protein
MEDVFVKLYKYMCDAVVGSEKVVNYRRQFFNVYDDVRNHSGDNDWHLFHSRTSYTRSRVKPGIALSKSKTKLNCVPKSGMKTNSDVINGPCISDRFGTMDVAFCLRYAKWPSVGRQWIDRPEQCHVLMILVAIHTTGVYRSIVFLQRAT